MTRPLDLRIGIDVGGTHTDAVVLDASGGLLAKAKVPTTDDLGRCISAAVTGVVGQLPAVERVTHVMLGSTHATNAIVARRGLGRVAVVRIGAPATTGLPPFTGWPADLRAHVDAGQLVARGGFEFDGAPFVPLDDEAIARFCGEIAGLAESVAISSLFAPVNTEHELLAHEIVRRELGPVPVSVSHEIGTLGLLERENATILNAALLRAGEELVEALRAALGAHELDPVALITQNDGTLMALDYAQRYPVLTIGSGPANSMRGAAHLTGLRDGLVADIGGTTTDIGILVGGYPRQSMAPVEIGGVRTNFRMPDVISIGVGGGTVVEEHGGEVTVGPHSVGHRLVYDGLVFGGDVATLTDAAVAGGLATLGTPPPPSATLRRALEIAHDRVAQSLDQAKHAKGDQALVIVGGGSILIPDRLDGMSAIHRPSHYEVANAIGAAIGEVSGQVDRVVQLPREDREAVLANVREAAIEQAVRAGANPDTTEIVEVEEIPLAYLEGATTRVRAKAIGPIQAI